MCSLSLLSIYYQNTYVIKIYHINIPYRYIKMCFCVDTCWSLLLAAYHLQELILIIAPTNLVQDATRHSAIRRDATRFMRDIFELNTKQDLFLTAIYYQ